MELIYLVHYAILEWKLDKTILIHSPFLVAEVYSSSPTYLQDDWGRVSQVTPLVAKLYGCLACREYIQRTDQYLLLETKPNRLHRHSRYTALQFLGHSIFTCQSSFTSALPLMVSQFPKFNHQAKLYNILSMLPMWHIKQLYSNISDILFHIRKSQASSTLPSRAASSTLRLPSPPSHAATSSLPFHANTSSPRTFALRMP